MERLRVGFIGLGIMGSAMAMNIHKAGFPLIVYNRTKSKTEPFAKLGIPVAESPREVAEKSDVVIDMVTDAPDVEEVLLGPNGVVHGAHPGLIVIDMSTNSPDHARYFARELGKYGIEFLDAPVTGGDIGARQGTLTIMVGGKYEVFEKVKPILQAMGKTIIYAGDVGNGQMLKLLNQIVVGIDMLAVAEAMALARKAGIDMEKLFTVLSTGAANSFTVQYYMPKMMKGDFEPGFRAAHLKKDLRYALETANRLNVPLPGTALTLQLYNALVAKGLGEKGTQALLKLYYEMAGISDG
ncbi:NAD(P)-dependent oxidoreductase [Vulcanisaeta distributa]|uniref:6-phosphogluconate dehydrogenase NAD-binding protein n=1 Tax=Vulcanisaeta distributa (strain DSM 14429 / JCM 11212 / NBRC 100878 / IC-017) TaxID=572478 RepID=E1QTY5_VULDI|nr:NAD(P)-dependent oxidoreductase [Vulcanisaeta distributa]ADN49782.1 6-phosphogluconate dehydrogenase NAD-binding protein [Vulcanisaeta distributa DSM 14429]